jgi:hypothetical protein
MHILFSEELRVNQLFELNRIVDFLGIESYPENFNVLKEVNVRNYTDMDVNTLRVLNDYFRPYNDELFSFLGKKPLW